ncbi:MAG: aminodeoxychorismate synthase component I [Opitutaceae bacterium]|nr:aminodeoxychorismate synthase component I [Opitutaceae bacterium]
MKRVELPYGDGLLPLFRAAAGRPHRVFLESSLPAVGLGRYSIFGYEPREVVTAVAGGLRICRSDGSGETLGGDPWDLFSKYHRQGMLGAASTDLPLCAGAIGYLGYEAGLGWERVPARDSGRAPFSFGYYEGLLVADLQERRLWATADCGSEARDEKRLEQLIRDVETWRKRPAPQLLCTQNLPPAPAWTECFATSFSRSEYDAAIGRVRDYIASGDVYQVNLAQRFSAPWKRGREEELYFELRQRSPAPYASFIDAGGELIAVGCSPERFLSVREGRVSTRPIKGTRPRGSNSAEDEANRRELLASEKDRAELLMIVDLERNDLGRVCVPGSISVTGLYSLEAHPTVFHLVAEVCGQLVAGKDALDVIRASFPGGSITGAPKVRAMQVISELEGVPRGVYTGAVGYLGSRGECELNVAIRTIQCLGDEVQFHAGSGVVWDSSAAAEYDECLAKGRAMAEAILTVSRGTP